MTFIQNHNFTNTGINSNDLRESEDAISAEAIMNKMNLRYTYDLHNVDWKNVIRGSLPFLSPHREGNILHISGEYSINPLVLLTKVLLDEKENQIKYSRTSDKEYTKNLKRFANGLSIHYQEGYLRESDHGISPHEQSLRKAFVQDETKLMKFLYTYHEIMKKHEIPFIVPRKVGKRTANQEISLQLPYSRDECWTLSGKICFDFERHIKYYRSS